MIDTKAYKQTMASIYKEITEEKKFLQENGVSLKGASENENIDDIIQKTKGTSFKLLVMRCSHDRSDHGDPLRQGETGYDVSETRKVEGGKPAL